MAFPSHRLYSNTAPVKISATAKLLARLSVSAQPPSATVSLSFPGCGATEVVRKKYSKSQPN
jgi:hypothetical protein